MIKELLADEGDTVPVNTRIAVIDTGGGGGNGGGGGETEPAQAEAEAPRRRRPDRGCPARGTGHRQPGSARSRAGADSRPRRRGGR